MLQLIHFEILTLGLNFSLKSLNIIFLNLSGTTNYRRGLYLLPFAHEGFFLIDLLHLNFFLSRGLQRVKSLQRLINSGSYILYLKICWRRLRWHNKNVCKIIWESLRTVCVIVLLWFERSIRSSHNSFGLSLWCELTTFDHKLLAISIAVVIKLHVVIFIGIDSVGVTSYPDVLSFVIYEFVSKLSVLRLNWFLGAAASKSWNLLHILLCVGLVNPKDVMLYSIYIFLFTFFGDSAVNFFFWLRLGIFLTNFTRWCLVTRQLSNWLQVTTRRSVLKHTKWIFWWSIAIGIARNLKRLRPVITLESFDLCTFLLWAPFLGHWSTYRA